LRPEKRDRNYLLYTEISVNTVWNERGLWP